MKSQLVIVESPTKAKTIAKFLGKGYKVMSSFGHIRDLPKKELGVDTEHDFHPKYVIPTKSKKIASELKKAAKTASMVYFASDEDREGEAIAWHLQEMLKLDPEKTKRITFHEITEEAIHAALKHPRQIDDRMVDAQQARRVLDRLVGYELSPFLWRKVARGLSAGRVQSVAVRLIVEREREISGFVPKEYWTVEALLKRADGRDMEFPARLAKRGGETLDKFALPDASAADAILADLKTSTWRVADVERKKVNRSPQPPFTTSTLQQDANNKLGFSAKQTMMIAQQLYEGVELGQEGPVGLITYMRTDSVNLADKFIGEAREYLQQTHGKEAVPAEARRYKTKSKNAQEAHEAIRPTEASRTPEAVASHLDDKQRKLYELIWRRALASQMADAELAVIAVEIEAKPAAGETLTFNANGTTVAKRGYLDVYESEIKETTLPMLAENDGLNPEKIEPKQHFTEPPPRYTEATLVKTLEENGIGRPSTYAPTISTVVDRGYVKKDNRRLEPTELAFLVNDLLVAHFPDIVDYNFTARMEDNLDSVAAGEKAWVPVIKDFYGPFKANLLNKDQAISKKDVAEQVTDEKCEKCGEPMIVKFGRYGKFLACSGFPKCRNSKPLPGSEQAAAVSQVIDEKCPACGAPMTVRRGRFGEFVSCSRYPECKTARPLLKKVGAKCPSCKEGDMVEKKTRGGKTFYACSRYPECKFALWARPTGENCPKCGSLLTFAKADTVRCSNKECDYERTVEK
ncbi:MAG: type I DNA topoisomerase [Patescibacteria group bacterium]|nr:type I DNA topoisomerase [Patescibacteria group bacterium]